MADSKSRHWCLIVYPDAAPADWIDKFDAVGVPWACSPCHDMDIEDDSEPDIKKKAHYHVIVSFDGPTTYKNVNQLFRLDTALDPNDHSTYFVAPPSKCNSVRSSIQYFVHKNHPHKFQYDVRGCHYYNGFDPDKAFALSTDETNKYLIDITRFIKSHGITEWDDIWNYATENDSDWMTVLQTSGRSIQWFLHSRRWKLKDYTDSGEVPITHNHEPMEIEHAAL